MKTNSPIERLYNGVVKENPTFVMMIGMCPTLAVTTAVINGIGMGLTTMVILTASNVMISALRKFIPDGVRMPAYIGIVVVNCIILGRAEAFAGKNQVLPSMFDGIGMGFGFTIGLTSISAVRELIGAGTLLGFQVLPSGYEPVNIFILAPGAFLVLAMLTALLNKIRSGKPKKSGAPSGGCGEAGCGGCGNSSCAGKGL